MPYPHYIHTTLLTYTLTHETSQTLSAPLMQNRQQILVGRWLNQIGMISRRKSVVDNQTIYEKYVAKFLLLAAS